MFLIVTRSFPPDVGGMQVLMGGLSKSFLNHGPVKVFANEFPNSKIYDSNLPMLDKALKDQFKEKTEY